MKDSLSQTAYLPLSDQLVIFRKTLNQNRTLLEILNRARTMALPSWYLVAGCLSQTIWNVVTERDPEAGISDYDLIYFDDSDLSWEAEDDVIQRGHRLFDDLPVSVEIRNQARVHLWLAEKNGMPCPPHASSEAAISTFPANITCLGVRLLSDGQWTVYAPYGMSDVFNLVVRPSPGLAPASVYETKTARWKAQWPGLKILPWLPGYGADQDDDEAKLEDKKKP